MSTAGAVRLRARIATATDSPKYPVVIEVETPHGLARLRLERGQNGSETEGREVG